MFIFHKMTNGQLIFRPVRWPFEFEFRPNIIEDPPLAVQNLSDQFTPEGAAVIERAKEHARKYKHSHISPEHLLLSIVEVGGPEALKILQRGRATPAQVTLLIQHHLREGDNNIPADQLNFSERGKRVLEAARLESVRVQSPHIEPRHILLGLSKVHNTVAAAVLGAVDLKGDEAFS